VFFAIVGSQNGVSTMRLLLGHKQELSFPKIEKVIVISLLRAHKKRQRIGGLQRPFWTLVRGSLRLSENLQPRVVGRVEQTKLSIERVNLVAVGPLAG
jgi:hypothetical protein